MEMLMRSYSTSVVQQTLAIVNKNLDLNAPELARLLQFELDRRYAELPKTEQPPAVGPHNQLVYGTSGNTTGICPQCGGHMVDKIDNDTGESLRECRDCRYSVYLGVTHG